MSEFAARFEDLEIWQQAGGLANYLYDALVSCRYFSFRDLLSPVGTSAMNHTAEGFERKTAKDFRHFLDVSKASSVEQRGTHYHAAGRRSILSKFALQLRETHYSRLELSHSGGNYKPQSHS